VGAGDEQVLDLVVGDGGDGNGSVALFSTPISIAVDAAENVYVADYGNSTIRKIIPGTSQATTQVSTIVGQTGGSGWAFRTRIRSSAGRLPRCIPVGRGPTCSCRSTRG